MKESLITYTHHISNKIPDNLKIWWNKIISFLAIVASIATLLQTKSKYIFFIIIIIYATLTGIPFLFSKLLFHNNKKMLLQKKNNNFPEHLSFLQEFITSVGFNPIIDNQFYDIQHHISKITKNFTITENNLLCERVFEGENVINELSDGLRITVFGGSSTEFNNLKIIYQDLLNRPNAILSSRLIKNGDRCKLVLLPFIHGIQKGARFKISFSSEWKNAMRIGLDGVYYHEPVVFKQGINTIESTIKLDQPVSSILLYSYCLETEILEMEIEQPVEEQTLATEEYPSVYLWKKHHPQINKVYILVFERLQ